MRGRIRGKWRPPLALVLGGTLAAVFALPLFGIGYLQVAGGILGYAETSWMIGWMALLSVAILGFLLWRLVLKPVRALTAYADAVADGQDAEAPDHFGTPELSALGASVGQMSTTLHTRAATVRSYADHVTHELKSPLTTVRGAAELLSGDLDDQTRATLTARITEAADQMTRLIDAQRDLALARDPVRPGQARVSDVLGGRAIEVAVAQDEMLPIAPERLEIVLTHLIGNAAAHGATRVDVTAAEDVLQISDNGRGVSSGNRDRIFEPFFTTRRDTGGTGMGLAIVHQMLAAQGAQIELAPSEHGASFVIQF